MKKLLLILILCYSSFAFSQGAFINYFSVKPSLSNHQKLAIIAVDSTQIPLEKINGDYTFSVNGFSQVLSFKEGVAVLQLPVEKSLFLYVKHTNELGTHSQLLYIYKNSDGLKPFTISRIYLIIIPILLILLVFAIKRFIYIAAVLFVLFVFFGYQKGLNLSTYLETIFDYLKAWLIT